MPFINILDSQIGSITLSVLLGLGLAVLFKKKCKDSNCNIIHVNSTFNSESIERIKDKDKEKCYKYEKTIIKQN